MKAMHQDRAHRYDTANGFAADLRRHLADEPVTARPPSTRYRVGKFVRRHRAGVLVAGALSMMVIASTITATVGMVRATRAERVAAQEAAAARQVTDFLVTSSAFRIPARRVAAAATGGFSQTPEAANASAPAATSGVSSGASLAPPPGVLIPPGKAPEVSLLYTGDVIGFIEPCG